MSNQDKIDRINETTRMLNLISPSFCLAKWLQTTVLLQNGFTHSCHHPPAHKISPETIRSNPSGLHNTPEKKLDRAKMLRGERPAGCSYCWKIEDLPGSHISDRSYKSATTWAKPNLPDVLQQGSHGDINPTYFEVSFDSTCNFKCAYCGPDISSKWMEEINQYGPYPTSRSHNNLEWLRKQGQMPIPNRESNPYIDAFWEWWPDLYQTLHTFRITGGEPLLSKHTWRVLDYILEHPRPDLVLAINSNMDVPGSLQARLIEYAERLQGKVKTFDLFTSAEATGVQAEYIRYGMDYQRFTDNLTQYLKDTPNRIHMMVAFNLLSITTFGKFIDDIMALRRSFNEHPGSNRVTMMINYVRWPAFLDVRILPQSIRDEFVREMQEKIQEYSYRDGRVECLYLEEIDQINRLIEYLGDSPDGLDRRRKDFALFITEYDRRRSLNFPEVFPELSGFLMECQG